MRFKKEQPLMLSPIVSFVMEIANFPGKFVPRQGHSLSPAILVFESAEAVNVIKRTMTFRR
jgi:hypothetical protein